MSQIRIVKVMWRVLDAHELQVMLSRAMKIECECAKVEVIVLVVGLVKHPARKTKTSNRLVAVLAKAINLISQTININ